MIVVVIHVKRCGEKRDALCRHHLQGRDDTGGVRPITRCSCFTSRVFHSAAVDLSFDFARITTTLWILIGFYAIAASVLSTWLWLTGLRHVPASQAGVFTTALPITSAAVGIVFLGERPTIVHGITFVCAFAGIVLMTRGRGR